MRIDKRFSGSLLRLIACLRQHTQLFQTVEHTVFFYAGADVICYGFGFWVGVAHGHAEADALHHFYIVKAVANGIDQLSYRAASAKNTAIMAKV